MIGVLKPKTPNAVGFVKTERSDPMSIEIYGCFYGKIYVCQSIWCAYVYVHVNVWVFIGLGLCFDKLAKCILGM